MLIPIAHEDASARSLPWVTFGLMAACALAFVFFNLVGERRDGTQAALSAALEYYLDHPYLRPDSRLLPEQTVEKLGLRRDTHGRTFPEEQARLDELTAVWVEAAASDPSWRFGLIPAAPRAVGYVTHAFLHGGWLHLLGNMLFLYLSAPFVEDRWGRWRFALFYLVAAVVSGAAFAIHFPYLYRPLVGASGAISAVMAAFMVYFWKSRIRFLFAPIFPLPPYWKFGVPAFVVVPGYFALDLIGAAVADQEMPGMGTGTAHDAHIAGFAVGLVVALVAKTATPPVDTRASEATSALATIHAAIAAGQLEHAAAVAVDELRRDPTNDQAAILYWGICRRRGEALEALPTMLGVLRRGLRSDGEQEARALNHWREIERACPAFRPDAPLLLALVEAMQRRGETRLASRVMQQGLGEPTDHLTTPLLLRLLRLAAALDPVPEALATQAAAALGRAGLEPEARRELEGLLPTVPVGSRARSFLD